MILDYQALYDRLLQLKPQILVAELSYWYNGKRIDISTKINACLGQIPDPSISVLIGGSSNFRKRW